MCLCLLPCALLLPYLCSLSCPCLPSCSVVVLGGRACCRVGDARLGREAFAGRPSPCVRRGPAPSARRRPPGRLPLLFAMPPVSPSR
ncbi:hypothetical protein SLNHY_4322 [Streptomyces albus]|nr:hypothetical protein SLNHY_4322 [Streptomyces albus]